MSENKKVYLVGGGIASLSAAFFLLEDGGVEGEDITIIESGKLMGGSLDGDMQHSSGAYIMRGHRILDSKTFECTFALLDRIQSSNNSGKSIKDDIISFNQKVKTHTKARVIEKGKIVDSHSLGLNVKQKYLLVKLFLKSEKSIIDLRINEYFDKSFFESNFWIEFATTFAFQPWHSLVELRRYIYRSFHALKYYDTMDCIINPPLCYHDSIVLPIINFLRARKVNFLNETKVRDLKFNKRNVSEIVLDDGAVKLESDDIVIVTLGSMTSHSSFGSNDESIDKKIELRDNAWRLWEKLSKKNDCFGNPKAFDDHENRSKWMSFTSTFFSPLFFDLMEKKTGNKTGTSGGTTLKGSNWFLSIGLPHQPHFLNQEKNVFVAWGYALSPDKQGNYVKKKMQNCSGKEILKELCCHLGFKKYVDEILETAITIPCYLPLITSQFSLRKENDRPKIIPDTIDNLGLVGQYVELPHDISFTVEYSVRSAQTAVYSLLKIRKQIPKIYKGHKNLKNIFFALKTLFR